MFAMAVFLIFASNSGNDDRGGEYSAKYGVRTGATLERGSLDRGSSAHDYDERSADSTPVGVGEAQNGDWMQVVGAGDNQDALGFSIEVRGEYHSDGEQWTEYYGRYRGRDVCVEFFQNGEVGVVLVDRVVTLNDLDLTEDHLIGYDQGDAAEPVQFDRSLWEFKFSGEVTCREDGSSDSDGYYGWDFVEQGGQRILSIEKHEDEPFKVCLVQLVDADRVQISRN